jgi:diphosphomevalonate decarboxylase
VFFGDDRRGASGVSDERSVTAVAHANIALAKYWGKADDVENLPAVPSLSLTLEALRSRTTLSADRTLGEDQVSLDGVLATGRARERVVRLLDEVRALTHTSARLRVESHNDFPTASGLASSASGFAALALGACHALGQPLPVETLSSIARRASASAARSLFGGFVALRLGARSAEPLLDGAAWPLSMVIAVTAMGPKSVSSTDGMRHTLATSPYYRAWVEAAPALFAEVERAIAARDLATLGAAVEQSALMMHASMLAARPAIVYFTPATLRAMERVRALRRDGTPAFYTMDAGPHVKVLCETARAAEVAAALGSVEGVERVIVSAAGPAAYVEAAK